MSKYMNDPEYLFAVLTAIVKKNGGYLSLSKEELKLAQKGDLIGMYYEPKTGNLILKEVEPKDMLRATSMVREQDTDKKEYDN